MWKGTSLWLEMEGSKFIFFKWQLNKAQFQHIFELIWLMELSFTWLILKFGKEAVFYKVVNFIFYKTAVWTPTDWVNYHTSLLLCLTDLQRLWWWTTQAYIFSTAADPTSIHPQSNPIPLVPWNTKNTKFSVYTAYFLFSR